MRPALLSPKVIDKVRSMESELGGVIVLAEKPITYEHDERIVVTSGVYVNLSMLVQKDEGERIKALFGTMTMNIPKMIVARV